MSSDVFFGQPQEFFDVSRHDLQALVPEVRLRDIGTKMLHYELLRRHRTGIPQEGNIGFLKIFGLLQRLRVNPEAEQEAKRVREVVEWDIIDEEVQFARPE